MMAKGSIQRRGTSFDMLKTLAEQGAVKYIELRASFFTRPDVYRELFDVTFYRLRDQGYVQLFNRPGELKVSQRYIAITNEGISALEAAEERRADRVSRAARFIKMNDGHRPIRL
jgi:hypothetical protein